jgi:hypothetical protein
VTRRAAGELVEPTARADAIMIVDDLLDAIGISGEYRTRYLGPVGGMSLAGRLIGGGARGDRPVPVLSQVVRKNRIEVFLLPRCHQL